MVTSGTFDIVIQMPSETGGQNESASPAQPMQEAGPVQEDPVRGGGGKGGGDKSGKGGAAAAVGVNLAINAGKQIVSAAVSQIGLTTGNSYKQQQVENSIAIATKVIAYAGAIATQNYIAAVGMLVSDTINVVSTNRQIQKEREIADYQAERYAVKLGYTNARR